MYYNLQGLLKCSQILNNDKKVDRTFKNIEVEFMIAR